MAESYTTFNADVLSAAKISPVYPPQLVGEVETVLGMIAVGYGDSAQFMRNNLRGLQFQFAYRYIYDDHEKSLFSPFSAVLIPQFEETLGGFFVDEVSVNNRISIGLRTGSELVVSIELAVKVGELGAWNSYVILNKADLTINNDIFYVFDFLNDRIVTPLDQGIVTQSSNFSPRLAETQEFLPTNELAYGLVTEGFDNTKISATLTAVSRDNEYVSTFVPLERNQRTVIRNIATAADGARPRPAMITYAWIELPVDEFRDRTHSITVELLMGQEIRLSQPENWAVINNYPSQLRDLFFVEARSQQINATSSIDWDWNEDGDITYSAARGSVRIRPENNRQILFLIRQTFLNITTEVLTDVTGNLGSLATLLPEKRKTFAAGQYKAGLVYSDRYGRRSSVQTSEDTDIYLTSQNITNDASVGVIDIGWVISHVPPMYAHTYQWVITRNLSQQSLLQWVVDDVVAFSTQGSLFAQVGIQRSILGNRDINSKFLVEPYTFTQGDYVRRLGVFNIASGLWESADDENRYEIIGIGFTGSRTRIQTELSSENEFVTTEVPSYDLQGNVIPEDVSQFLTIKIPNDSEISADNLFNGILIEIITPRQSLSENFYHAVSPTYDIGNPGTSNRYHKGGVLDQNPAAPALTPATGVIDQGDHVYRIRADFFKGADYACIDKSVSDYYESRFDGYGKVHVENEDSEEQQYNLIRHSGRYFDNTQINDLSFFRSSNYVSVDDRFGMITRIIQIGDALKVYQPLKTTSIYIGKSFIKQGDGTDQVMTVDRTFGVVNPSQLDYGCQFPESVLRNERHVYFFDIYSGTFLRDSPNGLFPVSENLMDGYFKDKSKALLKSGIENVQVHTGYDDENGLVFVSFVDSITAANNETLAFHEKSNRWVSFFSFIPDLYARFGSSVFTMKGQDIYIHNSDDVPRCQFYGTKYPRRFLVYSNLNPNFIKTYFSLALFTNRDGWSAPEITVQPNQTYKNGMFSRLTSSKFIFEEGIGYAVFMRNMRTKSSTIDITQLAQGDQLRGEVISILLEESNDDQTVLFEVDVNFNL